MRTVISLVALLWALPAYASVIPLCTDCEAALTTCLANAPGQVDRDTCHSQRATCERQWVCQGRNRAPHYLGVKPQPDTPPDRPWSTTVHPTR